MQAPLNCEPHKKSNNNFYWLILCTKVQHIHCVVHIWDQQTNKQACMHVRTHRHTHTHTLITLAEISHLQLHTPGPQFLSHLIIWPHPYCTQKCILTECFLEKSSFRISLHALRESFSLSFGFPLLG
jgi:hypothetical protein